MNARFPGVRIAEGVTYRSGRAVHRSDGYMFTLAEHPVDGWVLTAGCRRFTREQADAYYANRAGPIGVESRAIVAYLFDGLARLDG